MAAQIAREGLDRARKAFERKAWKSALAAFDAIDEDAPWTLDDIERHATAAHLTGDEAASRVALARGYHAALAAGEPASAARFAFWLGASAAFNGEEALSNGWFGRARSVLDENGLDCAECGYVLLHAVGVEHLANGRFEEALRTADEVLATGKRFADPTLIAGANHLRGRALIRLARLDEGLAALDEVLVAMAYGEVSPLMIGRTYCGVLEACQESFDLPRAREWTALVSRWCEEQPDLVTYRGPCLVHRVEVMRFNGDWEDALEEARRACDWLSMPQSPEGPGDAFYQIAELYRLRGEAAQAEEAYLQASRLGRSPQPGLSLLRLARGEAEAAAAAVKRALDEAGREEYVRRAGLLAAAVEARLALRDVAGAQLASAELAEIAAAIPALPLRAMADAASGSVLIAGGEAAVALGPLRRAWATWQQLEVPYEAARVRAVIAAAYRLMGDAEAAAMELDAARWAFERLGARADLQRLDAGDKPPDRLSAAGLTRREVEVLSLIAAGETNRAIAAALVLSEHTVARHVQNMLQKLGLSSRAGLAAFAVQQGLSAGPRSQK